MKTKKKFPKRKITIADVVEAAHTLGMEVSVALRPNTPAEPPRQLLTVPSGQWPGDPTSRSVMADLNLTHKKIEREFKDSPSSKWIITPYEIIERDKFFAMLQSKLNEVLCVKCGIPAAFPKVVTKPYVCLTCQTSGLTTVVTGTTTTTTTIINPK